MKLGKVLVVLTGMLITSSAQATLFEVDVNSGSFSPQQRTISEGDQIRWVWTGGIHTTTHLPALGQPVLWDEPITSSSQSYTHTFNDEGIYNYECTPHGFTGRITVNPSAGILDDPDANAGEVPSSPILEQNSPNPFNAATQIQYSLDRDGVIDLAVYNILGQKVRTLVSGSQPGGLHRVDWDGRDDRGNDAPTGIYFARLTTESQRLTRKMVLLR